MVAAAVVDPIIEVPSFGSAIITAVDNRSSNYLATCCYHWICKCVRWLNWCQYRCGRQWL